MANPKQIDITTDLRVMAAVDALRKTILAVNGDKDVRSLILYADIELGEHMQVADEPTKGKAVMIMDVCGCPDCCGRAHRMITEGLIRANAEEAAAQEADPTTTRH